MPSKVISKTLTVRVSEDIELNGKKYGNVNISEIPDINEVSTRIVTALSTGTSVLKFADEAGSGTYITSDVKYIRITNLDSSNQVRLALINAGTDAHVAVDPGKSFILSNTIIKGEDDVADIQPENITEIKAYGASNSSVDLEIFVASI
jgi:hypothetical protein